MRYFKFILSATVALSVVAASEVASASILNLLKSGTNQASDEDREYFINRVTPAGAPVTQIDIGDSFRGMIDFNTLNSGGANVGGLTGENELSGVFQVLVTGKVVLAPGIVQFTFGPDPAFAEGGVPGAIAVLWEDVTPNFTADFNSPAPATAPPADPTPGTLASPLDDGTGAGPRTIFPVGPSSADTGVGPFVTEEAFIATATDGARFVTLGFAGILGEGFSALSTSGDNVLAFFGIVSGSNGATSEFSLTRLDGPGVEIFDPVVLGPIGSTFPVPVGTPGFIGITGSQQLRGVRDLDTPFDISTNTNISFFVVGVPEPTSILVWAFIFTGLMTCRRSR